MGADEAVMRFLSLFLIILTACLLCIDTSGGLSLRWLTAPVLTAFLFSWPTSFLPRPVRVVLQFVIGLLFIAICLVDCFCQEFFEAPITPQVLSNVMLSNAREMHEFFTAFVGIHVLTHWRITALLLLAVALPFALFFQERKVIRSSSGRKLWKMAGIAVIVICLIFEVPPTYRYIQLFRQHQDLQKMEGLIFRHYHEEVPTPLHRFAFAYYSLKQSSYVLADIKDATFSAHIDSCSYLSPHIVLVVGESYNKHHSTLYGYPLATTPLQQQRADNGELYVFNNVVSPWNITSNVLLDIFSLWEYGMSDGIGTRPLFPILFRCAGYDVNFFSNQYFISGFRKGATNQAGHFFLTDREMSKKLFTYRNKRPGEYDMSLATQVGNYRIEHVEAEHTLDIIHLIGQHFDYVQRYPAEEAAFAASDYAGRNISDEAKTIVMHYDNATHYNDRVLDSILTTYRDDEAIVLFVADHGEEVYDDLQIHGRLFQEPTATQAHYEFEVPMWIWCSESYREHHPDIVVNIERSLNKPFMIDALPQLMLSLAGISCQWTDETRNLLSPKYRSKRRVIAGCADYDELMGR